MFYRKDVGLTFPGFPVLYSRRLQITRLLNAVICIFGKHHRYYENRFTSTGFEQ
jgi:hypothetical protein